VSHHYTPHFSLHWSGAFQVAEQSQLPNAFVPSSFAGMAKAEREFDKQKPKTERINL
jgi:hypothetical protein